ncbi:hypothetical protein ACF0H5_019271 [Mactra antiquata]
MITEVISQILGYFSVDIKTICLGLFVCVALHRLLRMKQYNPPLPPSIPFELPVIGHFYLLKPDMRKLLRKYRQQLGDVYRMKFGGRSVVIIAGYETIKEAFLKQADNFAARPYLHVTTKVSRNAGVAMTSGQVWKEHRRFCLSTLKDFGMGRSMLEDKLHQEASTMITTLRKMSGIPFDPRQVISTHVTNMISALVFKGSFKHDDERLVTLLEMMDENISSNALVGNFLPWLSRVPGDPLNTQKLIKNSDHIFDFVYELIKEHETYVDEDKIEDLTSAYIHEMRRVEKTGESSTMSYEQLSGLISDLFIAGSHTTATAIRWALACLIEHPHIQGKLYEEISSVVGAERLPSMMDKSKLVYLEAFYLEVIRYCNLAITSGVHATTHDVTFNGYTIRQDDIILPDLDSVLTDKHIWGDPDIFRPERFIDETGNFKKKEELLIFFIGKRSCLGEALARMELLTFIGALVQNFKFQSCPGEALTVDKVDGTFGFIHAPKPYQLILTSR